MDNNNNDSELKSNNNELLNNNEQSSINNNKSSANLHDPSLTFIFASSLHSYKNLGPSSSLLNINHNILNLSGINIDDINNKLLQLKNEIDTNSNTTNSTTNNEIKYLSIASSLLNNIPLLLPIALIELDLSHNSLNNICNISQLTELKHLKLDFNNIKNIENLDNNKKLIKLNIAHNQLRNIKNIGHLRLLNDLDISFNEIVSVDSLRPLSVLTNLNSLAVRGNPVATQQRIILNLLVNLNELDGTPIGSSRRKSIDDDKPSLDNVPINPVRPITANDMHDLESTLNLLKPKAEDISRALLILYPSGIHEGLLAIPHKYISLPVQIDEIDTSLPLIDCLRQLEILPHVVPLAMILRLLNSVVLQGFNVLGLEHVLHLLACCIVYRSRIEPFDKASQSIIQPFVNVIDMSEKPLLPALPKNNKETKKSNLISNDESKKLPLTHILIPDSSVLSLSPPPKIDINDSYKSSSKVPIESKGYAKPLIRSKTIDANARKPSLVASKSPFPDSAAEKPKVSAAVERLKTATVTKPRAASVSVVSAPKSRTGTVSASPTKSDVFNRLGAATTVASRAMLSGGNKQTTPNKSIPASRSSFSQPKPMKPIMEKQPSRPEITEDSGDHVQWADLMKETSSFPVELKDKLKEMSDMDPDSFKSNNELEENFLIPAFTRAATSQAPLRKISTRNSLMSPISMTDPEVVNAPPKVQEIIKNLNEKINKLYNWHLVEIDLVSRQQAQLNEMKSEINNTKAKVASVSTLISTVNSTPGTPQLYGSRSFQSASPLINNSLNYSAFTERKYSKAVTHNGEIISSGNESTPVILKNPFFNKSTKNSSTKLSHDASSHSLHGSVSKDQLRDALSRSLETLQNSEANSEEIKILNELLTKLDVIDTNVKNSDTSAKGGADTTAAALIEAGFEPALTLWLKELEDELAAAQLALSNLFDLTEFVTFESQDKVNEFEKQLRELKMFLPFPLPPDVAACFISLPEEMMTIIREHALQLDETKDFIRSFIAIIAEKPVNVDAIKARRIELQKSNLIQINEVNSASNLKLSPVLSKANADFDLNKKFENTPIKASKSFAFKSLKIEIGSPVFKSESKNELNIKELDAMVSAPIPSIDDEFIPSNPAVVNDVHAIKKIDPFVVNDVHAIKKLDPVIVKETHATKEVDPVVIKETYVIKELDPSVVKEAHSIKEVNKKETFAPNKMESKDTPPKPHLPEIKSSKNSGEINTLESSQISNAVKNIRPEVAIPLVDRKKSKDIELSFDDEPKVIKKSSTKTSFKNEFIIKKVESEEKIADNQIPVSLPTSVIVAPEVVKTAEKTENKISKFLQPALTKSKDTKKPTKAIVESDDDIGFSDDDIDLPF